MNQLGAILLAAGSSSRLGQSKQLLQMDGQTLVRAQAGKLLALNPACVVVVTGAEQAAVELALQGLPLQLVHNHNWQQGMGSSLALGIQAMPERVRGAMLLLCDQWKITVEDLQVLQQHWRQNPAAAVTAVWPTLESTDFQQRNQQDSIAHGPPVIFPRALFASLRKLSGDKGGQNILRHFKGGVERVMLANAAFDIDQVSDLP